MCRISAKLEGTDIQVKNIICKKLNFDLIFFSQSSKLTPDSTCGEAREQLLAAVDR
jgi:hypothetical protein